MFKVDLDISALIKEHEDLANQIQAKTSEYAAMLTLQTYDYIVQEAQQNLNSRRQMFLDNWKHREIDEDTHELFIEPQAHWIEDGLSQGFDMLPGFLKSPKAKTGANGKYLVIPFKHNKGPSEQTATQKALTTIVKKELKKRNISYSKIENNPDGSAKTGLLHRINVKGPPQTPSGKPLTSKEGKHFLEGLSVYQNAFEKVGKASTKKDVMTFRTASAKQSGSKWIHPGLKPMNFLEKAHQFAKTTWEDKMLPEMLLELGLND